LDIIGKEIAEGLDEPDSIEALENEKENDENGTINEVASQSTRKRRKDVSYFLLTTFEITY